MSASKQTVINYTYFDRSVSGSKTATLKDVKKGQLNDYGRCRIACLARMLK